MIIGVGLSTTTMPLSWLIRKVTGAHESHAWLYLDDNGHQTALEATFGGLKETPYADFKQHKTVVKIYKPVMDLSAGVPYARSLLGQGYDYDELVGGIWVEIGRWFKRKWHNPFAPGKNEKNMDCAEFVMHVLQMCKYPGADKIWPPDATPLDIENLMVAQKEPEITVP